VKPARCNFPNGFGTMKCHRGWLRISCFLKNQRRAIYATEFQRRGGFDTIAGWAPFHMVSILLRQASTGEVK